METTFEINAKPNSFRTYLIKEIIAPRLFAMKVGKIPSHAIREDGFQDTVPTIDEGLWSLKGLKHRGDIQNSTILIGLYEQESDGYLHRIGTAWSFSYGEGFRRSTRVEARCNDINLPPNFSLNDNEKIREFLDRIKMTFAEMLVTIADEFPEASETIYDQAGLKPTSTRVKPVVIDKCYNAFEEWLDKNIDIAVAVDKNDTSVRTMRKYIGNVLAMVENEAQKAKWIRLLTAYGWKIKEPVTSE